MKRLLFVFAAALCLIAGFSACNASISPVRSVPIRVADTEDSAPSSAPMEQALAISQITSLESGFSTASFSGDDGFESFLTEGGASSDMDVVKFLTAKFLTDMTVDSASFGCSTLTVSSPEGHTLFGRNFDWQSCEALVVTSEPTDSYASISTVNLGFITQAGGRRPRLFSVPDGWKWGPTRSSMERLPCPCLPVDGWRRFRKRTFALTESVRWRG